MAANLTFDIGPQQVGDVVIVNIGVMDQFGLAAGFRLTPDLAKQFAKAVVAAAEQAEKQLIVPNAPLRPHLKHPGEN